MVKTIATPELPASVEQRVASLLQPLFADQFRVIYDPAFPRANGTTFSWFQVIFAAGPAEEATARALVHERYREILGTIAMLPEVQRADIVALRARRHVPNPEAPDYPHMFIECAWDGPAVAAMNLAQDFAAWHSHCYSYVNRVDQSDPLNVRRPGAEPRDPADSR